MIIGVSGKIGSGKDTIGEIIQYLSSYEKSRYSHPITQEDLESYLKNRHDRSSGWEIKKYAGKLKQIASLLTGVPVEKFEDQEFKKLEMGEEWKCNEYYISDKKHLHIHTESMKNNVGTPVDYTYRKFLQILGTEAMRDVIHPNVWVNALFADYKHVGPANDIENFKSEDFDTRIKAVIDASGPHNYPNWIITDVRFPNEADAVKERDGIMIRVNRKATTLNKALSAGEVDGLYKTSEHPSETSLDDYSKFDYVIDNDGSIEDLIGKVREILIKEKVI